MRLSVFKWLYNLGYKRAEDRLYFALMKELHDNQLANDLTVIDMELVGSPDKNSRAQKERERYNEKLRQADELARFTMIVDKVFKPEQQVQITVENRFDP